MSAFTHINLQLISVRGRGVGEVKVEPLTRQLVVVHLSDVHFGDHHRFSPGKAVGAGNLPKAGHPTLADSLLRDLAVADPDCPVIVCITGDLVETGTARELRHAADLIKQLAASDILGRPRGLENIFVVPGNHDLCFAEEVAEDRWAPWTAFHNRAFGKTADSQDPASRFSFHNRIADLGAVILCLNSAEYVQKDTPEAKRGTIDQFQLTRIKEFLKSIPAKDLDSAIRIALIHHHPVLIPGLAESEQGYDAVSNAGYLLNELRTFGFHLVLHGHKHTPYHFSEDSFTAFREENSPPILIVAGGSVSSKEIRGSGQNCYNRLAIKWNPEARQGRIHLSTRSLKIEDRGREILPGEWVWTDKLIDDRQYLGGPRAPQTFAAASRKFSDGEDGADEVIRKRRYAELRLNMPVCEVMPSLLPGQHNEVRLWIEPHRPEHQKDEDKPLRAIWSAGNLHEVIAVSREQDERYCATMNYYGPMLVQVRLEFSDGEYAHGHVYARMPVAYQRPDRTIDIG
nr:metallophosphoesterase [Bradyrhizobium lablabi]